MIRIFAIGAALLFACSVVLAQTNSAGRQPDDSLPHDRHEGLSVSADAYYDAARAKEKFGKSADPLQAGILPVEVFLRNETDHPMHVNLGTIQLDVHPHAGRDDDIDSMSVHDVAVAVAHPHGPAAPESRRFPVGLPSSSDKKVDKVADVLGPFALDSDIVPPKGMIHGFLFFDLGGNDMSLAETASIYVPDVTLVPSQKPLMFFEVPVGKASRE